MGPLGAPNLLGPGKGFLPRLAPRCGAGHYSDIVGWDGASFCVPPLIPHSGAPAFNGALPGAPSFTAHAIGIFYGCDHSFYGRVLVSFLFARVFFKVAISFF